MKFVSLSVIISVWISHIYGQNDCQTPNGVSGSCIVVTNCPPMYAILNKSDRTSEEVQMMRKSFCGNNGTMPMVCCIRESCKTPDGAIGRCTGLYSCPHIVQMLSSKPVPQETLHFVQNSRCNGSDQYSVCCGPPPVLSTEPPVTSEPGQCIPSAFLPDPRTECCGKDGSADKITGGTATAIDQYPWLALIEYRQDNMIKLLCGGALISGKYVLTAGHCIKGGVLEYGTPINVRLGEYDTSHEGTDCIPAAGGGEDCSEQPVIIPIDNIIPHPEYNPNDQRRRRNDIALIRLKRLAPYTDFIRPICLPESDITVTPPVLSLYAAGWGAINITVGSSNVKLHVELPYKSLEVCQEAYNLPRRSVSLWSKQMCAGGEKGKDSCSGDSGGPLMYENESTFEVVGIVSFGPTPCGLEDVPGIYTKVYEYSSWIRSQIQP